VAGLSISAGATQLNAPVSFVANITAGTNVSYSWDFGDGAKGTGKQTSHTYTAPGLYTVKVTAKNSINEQSAAVQITIAAEPATPDTPITGLTISAGEAKLNSPVSLVANIATGTNVSYSWDFGNGATGAGKQTSHTYTSAGVYTVRVTAKNTVSELTAVTEVKIEEIGGSTVEPISGLSAAGPAQSLLGSTVAFNAIIAAGENVVFTWDFGDGASATGASVTHRYTRAGVYTVKVTASNELGSQSIELQIIVKHGLWMPMTIR
jgi:PKD repeat protein